MLSNPFRPHPHAAPCDLRGKTTIVTGASVQSIGFATARTLASWGADVVVTTRSDPAAAVAVLRDAVGSAEAASRIVGHSLDLADAASVERFATWFEREHRRLDVLINNAGIHLDLRSEWREPRLSADGVEVHYRTNYLGTAQLTHRLLPMLRATAKDSGDARVVNVVSALHAKGRNTGLAGGNVPYDSWVAYGTSKLGLVHFTTELDRRFGREGLRATCVHPGSVFTKIADRGLEGSASLATLRRWLAPIESRILLSPDEGAQTQLHCATHGSIEGGRYYVRCAVATPSADANDAAVATALWDGTLARLARLAGVGAP